MALVKCPECGKEVSDKAVSCPNCAYPFEKSNHVVNELKRQSENTIICQKKKVFKVFLMLTIICSACWIIMFFWQMENKEEIASAKASGYTTSISREWHMTGADKKIIKINNAIEIIKKIIVLPIILFGFLSVYYYNVVKKLKCWVFNQKWVFWKRRIA